MKHCIVLRHREDPWYLEAQREAVQRIYGIDVMVAGYPDTWDKDVDIELEYGTSTRWPRVLFDAAREIVRMYPTETLFLEGDMVPAALLDPVPSIRRYNHCMWPGILYTGDAEIDTDTDWVLQNTAQVFEGFTPLDHYTSEAGFDVIGPKGEFLHGAGGSRGYRLFDRVKRFKMFVDQHTKAVA
jgi:hypothetical protein